MEKFSIVIPVYYNEGAVGITMKLLKEKVIDIQVDYQCEVIFVDDGSGDNSFQELVMLREQYPDIVKVIKLTRNFGQLNAIMAGLSLYTGDCAIIMSADNQDPVSLINNMLQYHTEQSYPIVIATRSGRDESWFRSWSSAIFYRIMRSLSFDNMPSGGFDFVLLSKPVIATLQRNMEATPFFQGQILWTGYRVKFIPYHRQKREIGVSRWTLGKKITYLLDGVLSYSFLPIRFISIFGFLVAMAGFLYALIIIITKLIWDLPVEGWAPIMVSILVIGGIQMLMLGMLGEYLWRILAQVRNRELYVIEEIVHDTLHD